MDKEAKQHKTYDLFLQISKHLTTQLPLLKNRVIAAKWIRKIDNLMDADDLQKAQYLRLLTISMQSKMLVGPFMREPPMDDFNVQSINFLKPVDIQSMIVDRLKQDNEALPYHAEISGDLKEYVVYQEIPNFGSHFYYACSSDPITSWAKKKYTIMPSGGLESSVLVPPLPVISATKEEYASEYNAYLEKLKQKVAPLSTSSQKCRLPANKEKRLQQNSVAVRKCGQDSESDYVDYQLIGHGSSVESSRQPAAELTINRTNDELPSRISFFVGDDPEPFFYELAVKECRKDNKSVGSKKDKVKALALEYLKLGAVDCERDALIKAHEFLVRAGCI